MKALLLCEGKTDAILISYLLNKTSGWSVVKNEKKEIIRINTDEKNNESAYWYERGDDRLLICGVGGKDSFSNFFVGKLRDPILNYPQGESFNKLIIIHDKDTDSISQIENRIVSLFSPIISTVKNDHWVTNEYTDSFGEKRELDALALIIPSENEGALESVLLASLKEDEYDIVQQSETFVDGIKEIAKEYINKPRMELKAKLGVTFAVLSPMKVFSFIDDIIKSVEWEEYDSIKQTFSGIINM